MRQPKADVEEWTARVPAVLRAYRDIASVDDYLDCLIGQVALPAPLSVPPSPSPLDIPYAVGYLDAVWKSKTDSRLFVNLDAASVARLTVACGDEEDLNSLMSALADILGQVVRPGTSAPPRGSALEAVRDHLIPQLRADAAERVADAFGTLIRCPGRSARGSSRRPSVDPACPTAIVISASTRAWLPPQASCPVFIQRCRTIPL